MRSNTALVSHHVHLLLMLGPMMVAISTVVLVMTAVMLSISVVVI